MLGLFHEPGRMWSEATNTAIARRGRPFFLSQPYDKSDIFQY